MSSIWYNKVIKNVYMVYFFHTKYARDDLKYLVSIHPDYNQYDESELGEKDELIICIYLNLTALAEFINLYQMMTLKPGTYKRLAVQRFQYIDANIDNDAEMTPTAKPAETLYKNIGGFILRAAVGDKKYIFHPDVKKLLERKNTRLLLYNSWETRDLYRCRPLLLHYCQYHRFSPDKLILSITDHKHIDRKTIRPRIISYDWQYIQAKMQFSREKCVDPTLPKKRHLISLNGRCNDERLAVASYIYTNFREKCHLSFLINARSATINDKMLRLTKSFISRGAYNKFIKKCPLRLDTSAWTTSSLSDFMNEVYIMLVMETNIVRSGCQQISEKTYIPIKHGLPFMIWGSQGGILSHLHNLGFKTFSPFINESYDDPVLSYIERFTALINEITRILSLSLDDMKLLADQCNSRVQHNLNILESIDNAPNLL